ncbi:MAG: hypothetical protein JSV50_09525 [Desulfobacteraceae bacterium]|nr:MAG: hypothetical protein JSV50_09525 [Desulfobacteraceae bacterium]
MKNSEVKPSFSLRYFFLTLLTTLIIAGVGLSLTKYFESKPVRNIVVYETDIENRLSSQSLPEEQIEANYFIKKKDGSRQRIKSLFHKKTIVENKGNEGIENMRLSVTITDKKARLIGVPKFRSEPTEIIDAISIKKNESESDEQKHIWTISLLNPGESIVVDYSVYSEEEIKNIDFQIVPRKKDWSVTTQPFLSKIEKGGSSWYVYVSAVIVSPIIVILSILVFAVPFYVLAWNLRPHFRDFYNSFYDFYLHHLPTGLFESKSDTKKRFEKKLEESQAKIKEEEA